MDTRSKPLWLKINQVQTLTGLADNTIRRLAKDGRLGTLKIAGTNIIQYRSDDVFRLLAEGFTPAIDDNAPLTTELMMQALQA